MNDNATVKPSGKILFGRDYLHLMRWTQLPNEDEKADTDRENIVDAVAKLFLIQWEFSGEEVDEANIFFWDTIHSRGDEQWNIIIDRIYESIKNDKKAQEKLLIQVFAVMQMDDTFLSKEKSMKIWLTEKFDFRPSEIDEFITKGDLWRTAFDIIGSHYIEYDKKKKTK